MANYPAMQTSAGSLLRQLNPTIGPIGKTVWSAGRIEHNRWLYDYEMVFFRTGNCRVLTPNGVYPCRPGDVIVIPPGLVHCTIADQAAERWCVHFDWRGDCRAHCEKASVYFYVNEPERYDAIFAAGAPPEEMALTFPMMRHLGGEAAQEMHREMRNYFSAASDGVGAELIRQGIFLHILGIFLQAGGAERGERNHGNARFFEAKSLIDAHFTNADFSLAQLAEKLFVTPNHLAKLFRVRMGLSPCEYLQARRLQEAAALLRETPLPVAEIAARSGFADANYFTRYFRKNYGAPPTAFREAAFSQEDPSRS